MTTAPLVDPADLLAAAESVEPLPHTVARLATLVADPNSDIREIVARSAQRFDEVADRYGG